jgi:hypothetical protein
MPLCVEAFRHILLVLAHSLWRLVQQKKCNNLSRELFGPVSLLMTMVLVLWMVHPILQLPVLRMLRQ